MEINLEDLPNVQRTIVQMCAEYGKRVIVATHLLESMIHNPHPTRAEVTDVANAIYEEADAVMLSGETTVGKYPVKCVEYLRKIALKSETIPGLQFAKHLRNAGNKQQLAAAAVRARRGGQGQGNRRDHQTGTHGRSRRKLPSFLHQHLRLYQHEPTATDHDAQPRCLSFQDRFQFGP